jgi:hypothetical protein
MILQIIGIDLKYASVCLLRQVTHHLWALPKMLGPTYIANDLAWLLKLLFVSSLQGKKLARDVQRTIGMHPFAMETVFPV